MAENIAEQSYNQSVGQQLAYSAYNDGGHDVRSVWYLQQEENIENIIMLLKGFVWSEKQEKYVKKFPSLLNEEGCNRMEFLLYGLLHKGTTLTNWSEEEINQRIRDISHDLVDIIVKKRIAWEFDLDHLPMVRNIIETNIKAALNRGKFGWIGRFIQTTRREIFNQGLSKPTEDRPSGGFMSNLLKGRKNEYGGG